MLPFLVHKIFTFYTNGVLNCKCPAPGPNGERTFTSGQGRTAVLLSSPNQSQVHDPKQNVAYVDIWMVQAWVKSARSWSEMGLLRGGRGNHAANSDKSSINMCRKVSACTVHCTTSTTEQFAYSPAEMWRHTVTPWRGSQGGNWRMQWVASTLHTTSEHGASSITTADAHTSAASSRLNWRPLPV